MSFKNLETTWKNIQAIILSNTISGENSKIIEQIVDKKLFGCQSGVLANIFQLILGNKDVNKENGLIFLKNSEFITEKILLLGEDENGDNVWLDLEDGQMQEMYEDDLSASSPVTFDYASKLLGEIEEYQILQILSFYLKNKGSMDKKLQQKPTQKKLTVKEKDDKPKEILEDCDTIFEVFYGKIANHLSNLIKLKSVPEPKKVSSKEVRSIDLDGIVTQNYNILVRKNKDLRENETDVKKNLRNIFSLTLENQPVNPFSGYNSDVFAIVQLFQAFSSVSDEINGFQEKGIKFLSGIHPNFKQIVTLYDSLKFEPIKHLQVVKPKFLWDIDCDEGHENTFFFYDENEGGLNHEDNIVLGNFTLDRLFLEYPTVKEVAKFINSEKFNTDLLY